MGARESAAMTMVIVSELLRIFEASRLKIWA
jgi:hypothetical protein